MLGLAAAMASIMRHYSTGDIGKNTYSRLAGYGAIGSGQARWVRSEGALSGPGRKTRGHDAGDYS